jgi:hypothetical protein
MTADAARTHPASVLGVGLDEASSDRQSKRVLVGKDGLPWASCWRKTISPRGRFTDLVDRMFAGPNARRN